MTLFTLLIVMALERVTTKTKELHIATLASQYFSLLSDKGLLKQPYSSLALVVIALIPSLIIWLLIDILPGILVFILYLLGLWICLGCPVTRKTYKRYLQAANREDFQACSLHSMKFGNSGGELSEVGKQLVLVNYRQYASVILFFVFLGLPGMVFYSIVKEFVAWNKQSAEADNAERNLQDKASSDANYKEQQNHTETPQSDSPDNKPLEQVLFVLDWLPARITAFGYLLVGHFSNGLNAWVHLVFDLHTPTYDVLAKVAKASEDIKSSHNPHLQEAIQMVRLVKRNIIFILMCVSFATLVGVVV